MMVEVGDFSEFGEAWVRYQGNRVVSDYSDLLECGARVDPTGAFAPERARELIQFHELEPWELSDHYSVGGCWLFRVAPEATMT